MHYLNLGILIVLVGLLIGFYIHTDKKIDSKIDKIDSKIDRLSDEIKLTRKEASDNISRLSDEIKSTHKELSERIDRLSDRMDRLYDIQVHTGLGLRPIEHIKDKAVNE